MLEKTLESPLDYKEIQPVHPKGNWSWVFIGRTDAEAETPILWQRMETVTDFIFRGSKITADCDCSYEIKTHLFLGRKAMSNLDSIL